MRWDTDAVHLPGRLFIVAMLSLSMVGCSGAVAEWEWDASEDSASAPQSHFYYDYADDDQFVVGETSAVVRVKELSRNVLVKGTSASEQWTYTPAEIEIVEPGNSGYSVGETFTLAIPGGTASGVTSPSLWKFDKAELDPESLYLLSWTGYDYPNFALSSVAQFIYEFDAELGHLTRLQRSPEAEVHEAPATFLLKNDPVTLTGDPAPQGVAEALKALDE